MPIPTTSRNTPLIVHTSEWPRPHAGCRYFGLVLASILVAVLVVALIVTPSGSAMAQKRKPGHPMDALTVSEVARAVTLIKKAGHGDDASRFPTITLAELPKAEMLAWKPGDTFTRRAFVVMRKEGQTYEILVNLSAGSVDAPEARPGAHPNIILDEWLAARELTVKDSRWLAAIKKRGITDLDTISCSPLSPGYFANEPYGDRRILKVPCYEHKTGTSHLYGRPITGVYSIVDVEEKRVLDVVDLGVVKLPDQPLPERTTRQALKPVEMTSAQGRNYTIDGALQIAWDNWSFHMRMERRAGPVISLVRYNDRGNNRLVAYQMSLSEMFVPYMDPGGDWSYRTYLDSGEFGAGFLMSSLMAGSDCPADAAYVTMAVPNDTGRSFPVRRAACIFERNTGDPLWRHGNPAQPTNLTRPQVELVIRMVPTLGNYDYVIDWVFTQQGNIEVRTGSAGILAVKNAETISMDDISAVADTAHGSLVAPGTIAPLHDHFFNFRIDLDIDGSENTLVRDAIVPKRLPQSNPRRSLWVVESQAISAEGSPDSRGYDGIWRVINPNKKTWLGHNPGFEIRTGHQAVSALSANDAPQARAAFAAKTLWLTRHKANELFAAGTYPTQSRGGAGLPQYVTDQDEVVNKDLVVWLTVGYHHIPRVEDWPIMPTMWHGFTLRPFNFFDENPSYNVPAGFATPPKDAPLLRKSIE